MYHLGMRTVEGKDIKAFSVKGPALGPSMRHKVLTVFKNLMAEYIDDPEDAPPNFVSLRRAKNIRIALNAAIKSLRRDETVRRRTLAVENRDNVIPLRRIV